MAAMNGQPLPQPSTSGRNHSQNTRKAGAHQSAVVIPKNEQSVIFMNSRSARYTPWSWGSTVFASIALFFCCSCCSFLGLLCSMLSYIDHKSGDGLRSARKKKWSWVCTALAFILGLGLIVIVIVFITTRKDEFKKWLCDLGYNEAYC